MRGQAYAIHLRMMDECDPSYIVVFLVLNQTMLTKFVPFLKFMNLSDAHFSFQGL